MKSTASKKKADKPTNPVQTGTEATFETKATEYPRPLGDLLLEKLVHANTEDARMESQLSESVLNDGPAEAEKPRRTRRKHVETSEQIELPDELLASPPKMQYALLLALLIRSKGTVKFTAKDLETVDSEYNIVFSRTLDGRSLEVTVVSSVSGILKSPEHGNAEAAWRQQQAADRENGLQGYFPPPPNPDLLPQATTLGALDAEIDQLMESEKAYAAQGFALPTALAMRLQTLQSERLQAEIRLGAATLSQGPQRVPEKVQEMPIRIPAVEQPKDGSTAYKFPFETGQSPSTAGPMDLSETSRSLLAKDQEIAAQELEAIARQESS